MSKQTTGKFLRKTFGQIDVLKAEIKSLQKLGDNDRAQKEQIIDLEAKVARLLSMNESNRAEALAIIQKWEDEKGELNSSISTHLASLRESRAETQRAKLVVKEAEESISRSTAQLKDTEANLNSVKEEMELLNKHITELQAKDKDAKSLRSRLQSKSTELEIANRQLRQAREMLASAGLLKKFQLQPTENSVIATTPQSEKA